MADDAPVPLATSDQMQQGQFADLVRDYSSDALDQLMIEATRECEGTCGRRLAPFTQLPESHRAEGIDPDEYADSSNLPMDIQGTLGRSYADSLGASSLVRHVWLNETAPRYADLWSYDNLNVSLVRSYGGTETVTAGQLLSTDSDTGHVFFQLGLYLPIGTNIRITYDGGYKTIPADLVRACKLVAAVNALAEIDPAGAQFGHDPGALSDRAEKILANYQRG
ncbi:hypothetical protein [Streptantibioticus silvisoli]|uniref:Phage gp6-like head-tail connector protein n=1 Tax=Streptantibioticus silvisoli TaxID=2705255 RepID=A0ABT6W4P0_9ACTN|nr:hypothetical protein [Streptantibioticus silvisoli]MDI5965722.1 hypothetical protein [Streptantibioticus silvisoli]